MAFSPGAVTLFIAMTLLLLLLVGYASGIGKRAHSELEGVPEGNPAMERKVVVILGMMIMSGLLLTGYSFVEPRRQDEALARQERIGVTRGVENFTTLCISCHGIDGQGAVVPGSDPPIVAPQLNREDMRPKDAEAYKARYEYVVKTLHRGKGLLMPAWGKTDGGSLSDEQIHELALFITKGDMKVNATQTAWEHARELSREKIAHGAPEPQLPKLDAGGLSPEQTAGLALFTGKGGCVGCHVIGSAGGITGPALTNIATVAESRKPGTAADAYIEESIRNSQAFIVQGYPPLMPNFQGVLSDEEIKNLVAFLMTRK